MRRSVLFFLFLSACAADLPAIDGTISDAARAQPFPTLQPVDGLLAEAARPSRAASAGSALQARGARLAGRNIVPPSGGSLAERGARLRARADQLRAMEI